MISLTLYLILALLPKSFSTSTTEPPAAPADLSAAGAPTVYESPPAAAKTVMPGEQFIVTRATSLREAATHESDVIRRFAPGDEVTLLASNHRDWWKVRYKDRTGWVKKTMMWKR